jgi:hypothetical protein
MARASEKPRGRPTQHQTSSVTAAMAITTGTNTPEKRSDAL